jgi:hypothetical protein
MWPFENRTRKNGWNLLSYSKFIWIPSSFALTPFRIRRVPMIWMLCKSEWRNPKNLFYFVIPLFISTSIKFSIITQLQEEPPNRLVEVWCLFSKYLQENIFHVISFISNLGNLWKYRSTRGYSNGKRPTYLPKVDPAIFCLAHWSCFSYSYCTYKCIVAKLIALKVDCLALKPHITAFVVKYSPEW